MVKAEHLHMEYGIWGSLQLLPPQSRIGSVVGSSRNEVGHKLTIVAAV